MQNKTRHEFFYTKTNGTEGRIKKLIADFKVQEICQDNSTCQITCFDENGKKTIAPTNWPKQENKEQLLLTLEKFNIDQNNAIREISRKLQTSKKRIGYAGMKDKRAITSQKISTWKPDYEKIQNFYSKQICLHSPQWTDKRIELGDLKANNFEITIREIDLPEKETKKRISDCFKEMKNGIPNYFGLQRFGGIRPITHIVGKELIKQNLENATMIYLTATAPEEDTQTKNARQELAQTKNFQQATKNFPPTLRFERAIIHHLCKHPKDYAGAFQKLPKQLRIMFTHAYQSHLFNKIINKRLQLELGLKPTKGDILIDKIPTAPLFGFESKIATETIGQIEKQIIEEEQITLQDFKLKTLSELSSKGTRKQITLFPQKMKILKISKDETTENKTKATISFTLTKGNYATTVLREIMKKEPK